MVFDFIEYYKGCFLIPLSALIFFSISVIAVLVYIIRYYIVHRSLLSLKPEKWISIIMITIIAVFFLRLEGGRLANGGKYLYAEKETDAVSITGVIDSMELMDRYSFGELDSDYITNEHNGVCITIDGAEYKAIAKGNLVVGDKVEIVFLPKSAYILEIHKINDKK